MIVTGNIIKDDSIIASLYRNIITAANTPTKRELITAPVRIPAAINKELHPCIFSYAHIVHPYMWTSTRISIYWRHAHSSISPISKVTCNHHLRVFSRLLVKGSECQSVRITIKVNSIVACRRNFKIRTFTAIIFQTRLINITINSSPLIGPLTRNTNNLESKFGVK